MDSDHPPAVVRKGCCTPDATSASTLHADLASLLSSYDVNKSAASVKIYAVKAAAKL
jgi:hypothetical protein